MLRKKTIKKDRLKYNSVDPKLKRVILKKNNKIRHIKSTNYYNNMNIALIGSVNYDGVTYIRDFIFNIKNKFGSNCNIISRGNKIGCETYVKKYSIEFGLRYTEYNPAHTIMNLYSGMTDDYYDKPYHPTQKLHQYDCVVRHSDKIFYFGGILKNEKKHFEKLLKRCGKSVTYLM